MSDLSSEVFSSMLINAVFDLLYTRSSQSRRFPEKSVLGLTNEQTGVGARSNLSFKLEQTAAFPTIKPGHRSEAIAAVSSEFGRIHVDEIHAEARAAGRSEERRVGKAVVRSGSRRWSQNSYKKTERNMKIERDKHKNIKK